MPPQSPLTAFLDANVLIPAALRDTLLRTAESGISILRWSDDILAEVQRNLAEQRLTDPHRAARLVTTLRAEFPDAIVSGYGHRITTLAVDAGDQHVLAAAIEARVSFLVTLNTRHFGEHVVRAYGISLVSPDEFLMELHKVFPGEMPTILMAQARQLRNPQRSMQQILTSLRIQAPEFAELMIALLEGENTTLR